MSVRVNILYDIDHLYGCCLNLSFIFISFVCNLQDGLKPEGKRDSRIALKEATRLSLQRLETRPVAFRPPSFGGCGFFRNIYLMQYSVYHL